MGNDAVVTEGTIRLLRHMKQLAELVLPGCSQALSLIGKLCEMIKPDCPPAAAAVLEDVAFTANFQKKQSHRK